MPLLLDFGFCTVSVVRFFAQLFAGGFLAFAASCLPCLLLCFLPTLVGFVDATAACSLPFATVGATITASAASVASAAAAVAVAVAAASACLAADLCLCASLFYCFAVLLWGIIVVAVHGLLQSVV